MKKTMTFNRSQERIPGEPRLSPSDLPRGCTVTRNGTQLTIEVEYWSATGEPVVEQLCGAATVGVGEFSRRLFRVLLDVGQAATIDRVADDLAKAFKMLLAKAPQPGSRLNYARTSTELGFDAHVPPPWLIEVLRASSGSSGRASRP
jgi:hypothetical protein